VTTPPAPIPGQLHLTAGEREEFAARLELLEAERDRLARQMTEHTVRAVSDVATAVEHHRLTAAAVDDAVRAARAAGASWEQIGAAAGITRQSAHARWAHL